MSHSVSGFESLIALLVSCADDFINLSPVALPEAYHEAKIKDKEEVGVVSLNVSYIWILCMTRMTCLLFWLIS